MERIDKILRHEIFLENLRRNRDEEADRKFCRHDMAHFLDVARIGRIFNLEEGLGIEEELIYAAALLHDIGKHLQYSKGIPHEQASAGIAPEILRDCGFGEEETAVIVDAIACHRDSAASCRRDSEAVCRCDSKAACRRDSEAPCRQDDAASCRQNSGASCHGGSMTAGKAALREVLYRADKASRPCFCCEVRAECNWEEEKKNLELRY